MPVEFDPSETLKDYAHPEVLVTTEWLAKNLGRDGLVVLESDEDVLLYSIGHIPGAVKIDWFTELNDSVVRDYLDGQKFSELLSKKGVKRSDTVVLYGDKSNWWATYAFWVFKLFGHEDVRILNGGRDKWIEEQRELNKELPNQEQTEYPVIQRDDHTIRAYRDDVLAHFGNPLVDVRSPQEYSGERTHMPDYPEEGALRGGHIPSAVSIPWPKATNEDKTFKSLQDLEQVYLVEAGLKKNDKVIAYCRIGERSSHTWFVLTYLLGFTGVRNYDGSWTEWGSLVGVPIVRGEEPGIAPVAK